MQKIKYKITPLNIIAVVVSLYMLVSYLLTEDITGLGLLALIYVLLGGVGVLLIDLLIQRLVVKYKNIFLLEMLIVGVFIFWIASMEKTKTWLIPENFGEGYVTVIYDVEGAEKLPVNFFTWSYEVKIPESGILLTSTKFEDDLPQTDIKTYEGKALDEQNKGLTFGCLHESEMDCGSKTYKYRTWIVQKNGCEFSSKKADSLRIVLQNKYCK